MVKPEEAPRGYADLLHPRFKGELSIDTDPHRAVMAWLITWGEVKTREYIRALLRNGMMPRKGHTLQTQLLCAGEFKVGIGFHAYQVMQAKREKSCPIDNGWNELERFERLELLGTGAAIWPRICLEPLNVEL